MTQSIPKWWRSRARPKSQSLQEYFAYGVAGPNGTYVEIGAHLPQKYSNTYALEVDHGWHGYGVELDESFRPHWQGCKERVNPICWGDALTFDHNHQRQQQGLPLRMNYLSCDIDPPEATLEAMERVIGQGLVFDCITYEHDRYCYPGGVELEHRATLFLEAHGYKRAVTDVYPGRSTESVFETWFVHGDIWFPTMTFDEWKSRCVFGTAW